MRDATLSLSKWRRFLTHICADKVRSLMNARLQNPHANLFVLVNLNLQPFVITHRQ